MTPTHFSVKFKDRIRRPMRINFVAQTFQSANHARAFISECSRHKIFVYQNKPYEVAEIVGHYEQK